MPAGIFLIIFSVVTWFYFPGFSSLRILQLNISGDSFKKATCRKFKTISLRWNSFPITLDNPQNTLSTVFPQEGSRLNKTCSQGTVKRKAVAHHIPLTYTGGTSIDLMKSSRLFLGSDFIELSLMNVQTQ